MRPLTIEGRSQLEAVAQRYNVSFDAVATLLDALDRGNGTQAQFSHYELGGMGQWSRGGMIMIGDMFNNGLKYRVDQLCNELSDLLRTQPLFVPEPPISAFGGGNSWWPASCGVPSSTGSQNDMQYALFPDTRRLAIRRGGHVTVYDTGDHRIGGFSQQQGGDLQNLTFTSQYGTVRLFDLGQIMGDGVAASPVAPAYQPAAPVAPMAMPPQPQEFRAPEAAAPVWQQATPSSHASEAVQAAMSNAGSAEDDIFAKIERLHGLMTKGILSEAEFAAKKKDLLDRL